MSRLKGPALVRVDVRPFFADLDVSNGSRIGVVTSLDYNADGELCIKAGVGDEALHNDLAYRAGSTSGTTIQLPPEMYGTEGVIKAWREPNRRNHFSGCDAIDRGIVAQQIDRWRHLEAALTYDQTDYHLRLAGVALFKLLEYSPEDLLSLPNRRNIVFGKIALGRAYKRLRHDIYGS